MSAGTSTNSNWLGEVGDEIRNSFGELIVGLPQPEATTTLSQITPNGFGSMMKASGSLFIVEEHEKETFSIRYNVYAKPQTVISISAKDDAGLIRVFKQHEKEILATFRQDSPYRYNVSRFYFCSHTEWS